MSSNTIGVKRDQRLTDAILVYAGGKLPAESAAQIGRQADGLVVRGKSGAKVGVALRRTGSDLNLVFDPALYEREPSAQVSLLESNQEEVSRQGSLAVAAFLSPSHFIPDGDERTLEKVLRQGQEFCRTAASNANKAPALIVIPVSKYWLVSGLRILASAVEQVPERLALVLADRNDPLDSHQAVRGLIELIDCHPRLALLRSDLGVLGAMACGAEAGAIGTGTSVRHFVEPGSRGGGVPDDKTPSVLVPTLWSYIKGSKLGQAVNDNGLLRCNCRECKGQSLIRFADERLIQEAHRHSIESWYRLGQWMVNTSKSERRAAWREGCQEALEVHKELSQRSGVWFEPAGQLKAWADSL
jgi:hypothetical protein